MKAQKYAGLRYVSFGSGAKTMVVIPGLSLNFVTDSAELLERAFADFSDEFTLYFFDVREDVPEGYTLHRMADDLAAAFEGLALRDIYLLGCSMGGMEAICVAGRYPELIKKAVVAASSCRANETSDGVFTKWIQLARERKCHELTADMGRKIYSPAVCEASRDAFSAMADGLTDALLSRFVNSASAMVGADITQEAAAIKCPLFVVGSLGDKVMTAAASDKIAETAGARLFIYGEEYPHALYDEAPDFHARVRAFFA